MNKRVSFFVFVSAFAVACFLALTAVAHAATIPTYIIINPIGSVQSGEPFTVTGSLRRHVESGSVGLGSRLVGLYIETISTGTGVISPTFLVANVSTNAEGQLTWIVRNRLLAGNYRVYFLYQGSPSLFSSVASTDLFVTEVPPPEVKQPTPPSTPSTPVQLSVSATTLPIEVGETTTVTVQLTSQGLPLANYLVHLRVPGVTQQRETDTEGKAVFVIKTPLNPGRNVAQIVFNGKGDLMAAQQQVVITVKPPAQTTLMFVDGNKQVFLGDRYTFVAQLASDGIPVSDQLVRLYLDGKQRYGAITDVNGSVTLRLPHDMVAGQHVISATFKGTSNRIGSQVVLPITVQPRLFEVQTVPPLANVKIQVGDEMIRTNEQGIAKLVVQKVGVVPVTVLPYESTDPNLRAVFVRSLAKVFSTTTNINISNGKVYQIGFELSYPVSQQFVEVTSGNTVDPKRITNITLVNSKGEVITLKDAGTQWYQANRIIRKNNKLVIAPVRYSVNDITVDGVNVVHRGQQRFTVKPDSTWSVKLLMFDVDIRVRDALFRSPTGNSVRVVGPKSQVRDVPLDAEGKLRLESLSRGVYTVTVQGAPGIIAPVTIAHSSKQEVEIQIISYLDIGVVGGAIISIALLALIVGSPALLKGLRRISKRREVTV